MRDLSLPLLSAQPLPITYYPYQFGLMLQLDGGARSRVSIVQCYLEELGIPTNLSC